MFPSQSIQYLPVTSSNVAAIGYESNDLTHGRVHVAFKSGSAYSYGPVSRQDFETMMTGESVGKAVNVLVQRSRLPEEAKDFITARLEGNIPAQDMELIRLNLVETRSTSL